MYHREMFVALVALYTLKERTPKREFKWHDTNMRLWKKMKGLVGVPKFSTSAYDILADYFVKMAVLWDNSSHFSGNNKTNMFWLRLKGPMEMRFWREG